MPRILVKRTRNDAKKEGKGNPTHRPSSRKIGSVVGLEQRVTGFDKDVMKATF